MKRLTGHIAPKRLQGKIAAVRDIIGGSAAVIAPLNVTKNGTYDKGHSTATFTWSADTEYDFSLEVEGIPLRVKKADTLVVPESLDVLTGAGYGVTFTAPDGGQRVLPLSEAGVLPLDDSNSAYMTDELMFAVVWIRDAVAVNAMVGAAVFENNTVYVTDFLWTAMPDDMAGVRLTVTAPGPLVDGYLPVNVQVSAGPLDLANLPEVDSLEVTETSPTAVRYNGEIYLLVEE